MKNGKYKNSNRAFTLVELIIVIAILAIIMLIATLAYGGIQQRMKVRSDKATCGEIGKALAVREADLDKAKGIQLYPEVVEYDTLELVENYIKPGLTPQSMPDGGYIVTAIQTDTGKKILVGIGKNGQEISTDLYVDNSGAGWAWTEGKEISKFIEENNSKFAPVKTLAGITGGEEGVSGTGGVVHHGALYDAGDLIVSGTGNRLPCTKTNDGVGYYCVITGLQSTYYGGNWAYIFGISDVSLANAYISSPSQSKVIQIPAQYVPDGLYMAVIGGNPSWGMQTVIPGSGIPTYDYGNNQPFALNVNSISTEAWQAFVNKTLELTGFSLN